MQTARQQKFGKIIKQDLADIFLKEVPEIVNKAFITITDVKVSPDLGVATVYISVMMHPAPEQLLETIREETKKIRQILGRRIRNHARIVPHLRFFMDETAAEALKMEALLASLNIPKEEGEAKADNLS